MSFPQVRLTASLTSINPFTTLTCTTRWQQQCIVCFELIQLTSQGSLYIEDPSISIHSPTVQRLPTEKMEVSEAKLHQRCREISLQLLPLTAWYRASLPPLEPDQHMNESNNLDNSQTMAPLKGYKYSCRCNEIAGPGCCFHQTSISRAYGRYSGIFLSSIDNCIKFSLRLASKGWSFYSEMPAPETETWTILRPSLFWPNTSCPRHFLSFPLHPRQIAPVDEYRPNLMVIIYCIVPQLNQQQHKPFISLSRRCHFNLWHFNCNAEEEYFFPNNLQLWISYPQVVRLIRIYLKLLAI